MKIYFEDGELLKHLSDISDEYVEIDAKKGYSFCENLLLKVNQTMPKDAIVYTNALNALTNYFAWNNELKVPEIYLRNEERIFERIDNFTERELKEGHNIMRMYMAGEFDLD